VRDDTLFGFGDLAPAPPAGSHLRKSDYAVRECPLGTALSFLREFHYAGGRATTCTYGHGLFRRNCLVGVALWMPPTRVAALSVDDDWQGVLALSRLAVAPAEPTNAASFLLGRSMRLVAADRRFHTLLTYADERRGHTGAVYRATNWDYLGVVQGAASWVDSDGHQVSARFGPPTARGTRTAAEMAGLGYERIASSRKHKFVKRLTKNRVSHGP
jgi:hypothetical protein